MTADRFEHVDVLIVGAGVSGMCAAYYLQKYRPRKTFAIMEARGAVDGALNVLCDKGLDVDCERHYVQARAGEEAILARVLDSVTRNGIDEKIRFHHQVVGAAWLGDEARWLVDVKRTDTGDRVTLRCGRLC